MNGDGNKDLAFTATSLQDGVTSLFYIPNKADEGFQPNFAGLVQTSVQVGQAENIYVADEDRDGIPDLIIGKSTGGLQLWENQTNNGLFDNLTLKTGSYLGIGNSTSRQNPSVAVADLDADGIDDLIMGDQRGILYFFGDFRNFDPGVSQPVTDVIYNNVTETYKSTKLGGRIRLAVGNLFNSSKPAVVVGNTLGGLYILKNDGGEQLPEEPVVGIGPNPLDPGEELNVRSDRNTKIQIFSVLGQKMTEQVFVPANQYFPLNVKELAAGMYVARFTFPGKRLSVKFILK
jgi:hypothetical protein